MLSLCHTAFAVRHSYEVACYLNVAFVDCAWLRCGFPALRASALVALALGTVTAAGGLFGVAFVAMIVQVVPIGLRMRRERIQRRNWERWREAHR